MPVNKAQNPSVDILEEVIEDISVNNDDSEEINWEYKIEELSERIQQPGQSEYRYQRTVGAASFSI